MNDHEAHISDLRLDRLLAGELSDEEEKEARAHARKCVSCGQRLRQLTHERDAFAAREVPLAPKWLKRSRAWAWAPITALAAAAAVLLMLRSPTPADDSLEVVRVKGSPVQLMLARGRPEALEPLASGDTIHPGDYLQAGYSAPQDGFGAVLARDGAGEAFAYVPSTGDSMIALPAGKERPFPESTVLDNVVGSERIVLLWCDANHALAPMLDALRLNRAVQAPQGCEKRELVLTKQGAQ